MLFTSLHGTPLGATASMNRLVRAAALLGLLTSAWALASCSGMTGLGSAANRGDIISLNAMLSAGLDPNQVGSDGRMPLHHAARRGQLSSLDRLVEAGARIDPRDNGGKTPLALASGKGHIAIVQRLLTLGAEINARDNGQRTPLHAAADAGHRQVTEALLQAGANPAVRDAQRNTPLMKAVEDRHLEIVQLLLASGAPPDTPNRNGRTPLMIAVERRDHEVATLLLAHDADPNASDRDGNTPIAWATDRRDADLIALLVERGADPNTLSENDEPVLVMGVHRQDRDSVKHLLDAGAEPDSPDKDGNTPIVIAIEQGGGGVARLLLEAGANPNVWSQDGDTPLYMAVEEQKPELVKLLLAHGAEPDRPSQNGARPLIIAIASHNAVIADLLVEAGARPTSAAEAMEDPAEFINRYGYMALIGAALESASDGAAAAQSVALQSTHTATSERRESRASDRAERDQERQSASGAQGMHALTPPPPGTAVPATAAGSAAGAAAGGLRLPGPPSRYYSRRVAVVVGIDAYRRWPALEGARRDASAVSRALADMDFDEVIELYDADATRRRILTVLGTELAERTDGESLAVIYFAGHGQTESLASGEQRGYIVPVDADPNQVFATAISMDTLRSISSRLPAKQVYYAMDSCYSGLGFTRGISVQRQANEDYIEKITSLRAVQMITAGADGEQALESGGQGIFTRYLLRALHGEADFDQDGWVTANEIGTFVRPNVTSASRNRQTPRFGTLEGNGEVAFAVPARPAPEDR